MQYMGGKARIGRAIADSMAPDVAAELSASTGLGSNKPRREYLYRVSG